MSTRPIMPTSDFVIFLDADWEAKSQKNRQHFLVAEIARQLEGRSKILGVERPICPWTTPFRKPKKFILWVCGKQGLRQAGPNLYIYTPFIFIHNIIAARIPGLTALNRYIMRILLKNVLKKIGAKTDKLLVWIHHPYQLEDIGLVGEKWLAYDCYDDYIVYESSPTRRRDLKEQERAILRQADWVFVASKELLNTIGKKNKKVHLIPNGVEVEHFAKTFHEGKNSARQQNKLVLGFIGKITLRLDFQLLAMLADAHPDWNLVMIGPQEHDTRLIQNPYYKDFLAYPNVNLPGPKPYRELPAHMRSFDVCLLPYTVKDPFNIHCSPLKLYEYLASGKPIVSTDLPAVQQFKELVFIAQDAAEFERHVAAALEERDERFCKRRYTAAEKNSWEKRAGQILEIIETKLGGKSS